ncbi:unnamed protein product [Spirodela intermedia]|uniref:mitogen-activated protein kinase kinase n=1 Tax=Spirodela intermedia TaxID=51605 RepID=A0A7I8KUA2_SPIIN|nr:unnamed protein product [Spirodela intermedia]
MAVIRDRRPQLSLTLELPPKDSVAAAGGRRIQLVPPPAAAAAAVASCSEHRLADLERVQVLGHGNGGIVYKVRHVRTGELYALKLLHPHHQSDAAVRRQIYREIEILRRTDSPFVVRCHSIVQSGAASGDFALLLEYMDAGNLDSLLRRHRRLPEAALAEVARQVLQGLSYLHSQKIVHRDIKPSNLLVNRDGEIKISDFGVSKMMVRSLAPCNSYVGTCAYMSPERFDPDTYGGSYDGYAGDVWSLGLTVLELYLGHFPLLQEGQRPDWAALMCAICFGEPPSLPDSASDELRAFVASCLQREADRRWTVEQLLAHPFLTRYQSESSLVLKKLLLLPEQCLA